MSEDLPMWSGAVKEPLPPGGLRAPRVSREAVELHDGNLAGVGDRLVTRNNQRSLTTRGGRDFVKNGDIWTVEKRHRDGDLTVRHHRHGGCVRLPAEYVAESVELGYATTTARAQGMTVDTAHVLVDTDTSRESLYVAATRGRHGARLYVADEDLIGIDAERPPAPALGARDILTAVLHRESGERSATEVRREAAAEAAERQGAGARYVEQLRRDRHIGTVTRALGTTMAREVTNDPAFSALSHTLALLERTGRDPLESLRQAARRHELESARSVARVLDHRINLMTADDTPAGQTRDSSNFGATRVPPSHQRSLERRATTTTRGA